MRAKLTMYRCYWPQAFRYLQRRRVKDYLAEPNGLLLVLQVDGEEARGIVACLPAGAAVGLDPLPAPTVSGGDRTPGFEA